MPTAVLTPSTAAQLAAWRTGADDSPAGPLFTGGTATESDLVEADFLMAATCSICTASRTVSCC